MRVCPQCRQRTLQRRCSDCGIGTEPEPGSPGDDLVGTLYGDHFEVMALLGHGRQGSIYRAAWSGTGAHVALKVFRDGAVEPETFLKAMSIASRLTDPHTARVLDYGYVDQEAWAAVELLEGRSLRAELKRVGRMEESRILRIADQVCRSLAEAHAEGLLHQDLRPENVFLTDDAGDTDAVKVLDYGVGPMFDDLPGTTKVMGMPRYASPEAARGDPVDPRSDMYSLGVMLYEMAAGQPPFMAETSVQQLMAHLHDKPLSLAALWSGVISHGFDETVLQLLAKNPGRRGRDVVDLLGRIAELRNLPGLPTRELRRGAGVQTAEDVPAVPSEEGPPLPGTPTPAHGVPAIPDASPPIDAGTAPVKAPPEEPAPEPTVVMTAADEAPAEPPPLVPPPPAAAHPATPFVADHWFAAGSAEDAPLPPPVVGPAERKAALETPIVLTADGDARAADVLAGPGGGAWGRKPSGGATGGRRLKKWWARNHVEYVIIGVVAVLLGASGFYVAFAGRSAKEPIPDPLAPLRDPFAARAETVALKAVNVKIITHPEGAQVVLLPGRSSLGRSPVEVLVLQGEGAGVRISMAGFKEVDVPLPFDEVVAQPEVVVTLEPVP